MTVPVVGVLLLLRWSRKSICRVGEWESERVDERVSVRTRRVKYYYGGVENPSAEWESGRVRERRERVHLVGGGTTTAVGRENPSAEWESDFYSRVPSFRGVGVLGSLSVESGYTHST